MTDINFNLAGTRINLRVGAIIRHDHHVLLCRVRAHDWWYVPGGRIAVGETSAQALTRELNEELAGGQWQLDGVIASSENFFQLGRQRVQEYCLYFAATWLSQPEDLSPLSHEEFRWISLNEVDHYTIRPAFVLHLLKDAARPTTHSHFVNVD